MKETTLRALDDLRIAMEEDPRLLSLAEAEKTVNEDPELGPLYQAAEKARADYLLSRVESGEEDEKTKACLKRLHEAKLALDLHPSAFEYSRCYAEVNGLLRQIDEILFAPFKDNIPCGGHHDPH